MRTFIHSIGHEHYPKRDDFTQEALEYGATRRITIANLKQMEFGDRVLCAHKDGKSQVIFGEFTVEKVSGLTRDEADELHKLTGSVQKKVVTQRRVVTRGCGSYVALDVYVLEGVTSPISLQMVALALEDMKHSGWHLKTLMVGGMFEEHELPVRMRTLPHGRGFRPFDFLGWAETVANTPVSGNRKMPQLRGCFYETKTTTVESDGAPLIWGAGATEEVENYVKGRQS